MKADEAGLPSCYPTRAEMHFVKSVKNKEKTMLFKDSSREKICWGLSFSTYKYTHYWRTYAKASYRQVVE